MPPQPQPEVTPSAYDPFPQRDSIVSRARGMADQYNPFRHPVKHLFRTAAAISLVPGNIFPKMWDIPTRGVNLRSSQFLGFRSAMYGTRTAFGGRMYGALAGGALFGLPGMLAGFWGGSALQRAEGGRGGLLGMAGGLLGKEQAERLSRGAFFGMRGSFRGAGVLGGIFAGRRQGVERALQNVPKALETRRLGPDYLRSDIYGGRAANLRQYYGSLGQLPEQISRPYVHPTKPFSVMGRVVSPSTQRAIGRQRQMLQTGWNRLARFGPTGFMSNRLTHRVFYEELARDIVNIPQLSRKAVSLTSVDAISDIMQRRGVPLGPDSVMTAFKQTKDQLNTLKKEYSFAKRFDPTISGRAANVYRLTGEMPMTGREFRKQVGVLSGRLTRGKGRVIAETGMSGLEPTLRRELAGNLRMMDITQRGMLSRMSRIAGSVRLFGKRGILFRSGRDWLEGEMMSTFAGRRAFLAARQGLKGAVTQTEAQLLTAVETDPKTVAQLQKKLSSLKEDMSRIDNVRMQARGIRGGRTAKDTFYVEQAKTDRRIAGILDREAAAGPTRAKAARSSAMMRAGVSAGLKAYLAYQFIGKPSFRAIAGAFRTGIETLEKGAALARQIGRSEFGSGRALVTPQASTERLRAIQAIQNSGLNARQYLGREAMMYAQ